MDVIIIDAYPDTNNKCNILIDLISNIRKTTSLPIAIVSHYPVPANIVPMVDYHIYDAHNPLSEAYHVWYHHTTPKYLKIVTERSTAYHALACYTSIKNGMKFFKNKFENAHFFEYDALPVFPEYFLLTTKYLKDYKFVGGKYFIEAQSLNGVVTDFFSCNIEWFDNKTVDVRDWKEYRELSCDDMNYLILEGWLYNYFSTNNMLGDCHFLSGKECAGIINEVNIEVVGNKEPVLRAFLSETDDNRLMLFLHLYGQKPEAVLDISVDINGLVKHQTIRGTQVLWHIIDKKGYVKVYSKEQTKEFIIDPQKIYSDTVFRFYDGGIRCPYWRDQFNEGFI